MQAIEGQGRLVAVGLPVLFAIALLVAAWGSGTQFTKGIAKADILAEQTKSAAQQPQSSGW